MLPTDSRLPGVEALGGAAIRFLKIAPVPEGDSISKASVSTLGERVALRVPRGRHIFLRVSECGGSLRGVSRQGREGAGANRYRLWHEGDVLSRSGWVQPLLPVDGEIDYWPQQSGGLSGKILMRSSSWGRRKPEPIMSARAAANASAFSFAMIAPTRIALSKLVLSPISNSLARIIHDLEDTKSLFCYKHVVETVFVRAREAFACLTIARHSVCCYPIFSPSLPCCSSISGRAVPTAELCC
jgi:hypothetical protein